jgi:AcrR family transcriptional regulator
MIILFKVGTMPRVTDEYRVAKRREIADAALRAFRRKGFQATSMAEIIAESGLSAGAIYGHFKSKGEIIVDVATNVVGARILDVERLAGQDPMPPPGSIVRVLMEGMFRELGNPGIMVQLWGEAITEPEVHALATGVLARLRAAYSGYISLWHQREHGLSPKAADLAADEQVLLFVSAAQGYILQSALVADFDGEKYLTTIEKYLPR